MADQLSDLTKKVARALAREPAPMLTAHEVQELVQALDADRGSDWVADQSVSREESTGALAATFAVIRAAGHVENLVADFCRRHVASPAMIALAGEPGADAALVVHAIHRMLVGLSHNLERTMPPNIRAEATRSQDLVATVHLAVPAGEFSWSCGTLEGPRSPLAPLVLDSVVRHAGIPAQRAAAMAELLGTDLLDASVSVPHFSKSKSGSLIILQWVPPTVVVTAEDLQKAADELSAEQEGAAATEPEAQMQVQVVAMDAGYEIGMEPAGYPLYGKVGVPAPSLKVVQVAHFAAAEAKLAQVGSKIKGKISPPIVRDTNIISGPGLEPL